MAYGPQLDRLAARWSEQPRGTAFAPLADALRKGGALDDALAIAKAGVAARPEYLPGHLVLAAVHAERQEWWAAEQVLRAALALDPAHPVVLSRLHDLEHRDDVPPSPEPAGEAGSPMSDPVMVEIGPSADRAPAELHPSRLDGADPDDGVEEFSVEVLDDEPVLTESLAMLYRGQGHLDRALAVFDALVERHPDNATLAARRDALQQELEASRPRPFDAGASGGTSVRRWLSTVASAPSPSVPALSDFDAFYQTSSAGTGEGGDLAAFQAWLRELDR